MSRVRTEGPASSAGVGPLQPLDRLPPGRSGRIVAIVPREAGQLARLAAFGVVPGALVHLQQSRPAAVLRIGETTLALDPAIAAGVHVRIEEETP